MSPPLPSVDRGTRRPLGAAMRQGPLTEGSGARGEFAGGANAYGSVGGMAAAASDAGTWLRKTTHWLESSDDTDPALMMAWCCECEEDFKPRKIKAPFILAWLLMQVMCVMFQAAMFREIWQHLADFEGTLAANCGPEHEQHGVCLGPSWNLSYSSVIAFPPTASAEEQPEFDFIIPADRVLSFETASQPPTFLVGVEPLAPHASAGWKLSIAEQGSSPGGSTIPPLSGHGKKYTVASSHRPCLRPTGGSCRWTGSLTLTSKFTETASVHAYVVDSRIQHLEDIHKQEQCSFETSWQNFSERVNGSHHQVLINTWRATAFFLIVSVACLGVMIRRFLFYIEGGKLLSRLIVAKFLLQDVPQQLCIAAYLYGWYARNGLRCQMCLFHPQHCDLQYPLHWSNFMLCVFTMLSACSNQLLIQVKSRKQYDEEEEFFQCCVRFALVTVSTLPFSTSALLLSASVLQFRSMLVYLLAGIPAVFGWSSLLCLPMAAACDE